MSRVFRSERTGAVIYVFSDDHCPPHVHARQRGDGWIARVRFSFIGNAVGLMSLVPLDNAPLRRTLNGLLDEIEDELPGCRRVWWAIADDMPDRPVAHHAVAGEDRDFFGERGECEADRQRNLRSAAGADSRDVVRRHNRSCEYSTMTTHRVTDAGYAAAVAAGRVGAGAEIRAVTVRYVADRDAIELVTTSDAGFLIPRDWIGALQDTPIEALARLEVWPDGSAIALEECDIHISVDGLLTALLPAMLPARTVAAIFAGHGGRATSDAKRGSARASGRKRGRPRKPVDPAAA